MKQSKKENVSSIIRRVRNECKLRGSKESKAVAMLPLLAAYFEEDIEQVQRNFEVKFFIYWYTSMKIFGLAFVSSTQTSKID